MKHSLHIPLVVLALAALVGLMLLSGDRYAAQANEPEVSARVASTSAIQVGPQEVKTLFADTATSSIRSLCASRVVSTGGSAVMLSFHSSITPGASVGHVQGASSTVAYPADTYGCGPVTAYGFSSTTVTKSEFRW